MDLEKHIGTWVELHLLMGNTVFGVLIQQTEEFFVVQCGIVCHELDGVAVIPRESVERASADSLTLQRANAIFPAVPIFKREVKADDLEDLFDQIAKEEELVSLYADLDQIGFVREVNDGSIVLETISISGVGETYVKVDFEDIDAVMMGMRHLNDRRTFYDDFMAERGDA